MEIYNILVLLGCSQDWILCLMELGQLLEEWRRCRVPAKMVATVLNTKYFIEFQCKRDFGNLQTRSEAVLVALGVPSIPKLIPHIVCWKANNVLIPAAAAVAGQPEQAGIRLIPSGLRSFMLIWAEGQAVAPSAPMAAMASAPTPKGSGDVVDDSFHWMAQYPFSVRIQLLYLCFVRSWPPA